MKLVTVSTAFNQTDAHLTRTRLEAAGFDVIVINELSTLSLATGGVLVQVPEDQAAEAKEFLSTPVPPPIPENDDQGGAGA